MVKVRVPRDADRALAILLDDEMMRSIARSGRFRVVHNVPVASECDERPTGAPAAHGIEVDLRPAGRLRAIGLVDYDRDRAVTACVDLDRGFVAALRCARAEPRLAPAEEDEALEVALADRRVASGITLGDRPQSIVHAARGNGHRAAAVTFGTRRSAPSLVAIVDLARHTVAQVVPAEPYWG